MKVKLILKQYNTDEYEITINENMTKMLNDYFLNQWYLRIKRMPPYIIHDMLFNNFVNMTANKKYYMSRRRFIRSNYKLYMEILETMCVLFSDCKSFVIKAKN